MNTSFAFTTAVSLLLIFIVIVPAVIGIRRSCLRVSAYDFYCVDNSEGLIYMDAEFRWRARGSRELLLNSFMYEKSLQVPHFKRCLMAFAAIFALNLNNVLAMDQWDSFNLIAKILVTFSISATIVSVILLAHYYFEMLSKECYCEHTANDFAPTSNHFVKR
jgi:hypothetical protein